MQTLFQSKDLERISKNIVQKIDAELTRVGVFFRIFHRVKEVKSILDKIEKKGGNYYNSSKKICDIIGLRVILYFPDDIHLVISNLKRLFDLLEETIDENHETKFAPTRINLVFKLPSNLISEYLEITRNPILENSFEVQIRTILSEGWHEIDHDLRYKCSSDWNDSTDLSRNLNGLLAVLETSENSIVNLFDQLSYRHYKNNNFEAMLRSKFRLRFVNGSISVDLMNVMSRQLMKEYYKIDRIEVLEYIINSDIMIPLTLDNLIFLINLKFISNSNITNLTTTQFLDEYNSKQVNLPIVK